MQKLHILTYIHLLWPVELQIMWIIMWKPRLYRHILLHGKFVKMSLLHQLGQFLFHIYQLNGYNPIWRLQRLCIIEAYILPYVAGDISKSGLRALSLLKHWCNQCCFRSHCKTHFSLPCSIFVCRRYEALSKLEWLHAAGHQESVHFCSCIADDACDWHESWWWDLHIFNNAFCYQPDKEAQHSMPMHHIWSLLWMKATDIARAKELNIVVRCLGGFHLFIDLWAAWEVLWVIWAWRTSSALLWPWYCSTYDDWKGMC